MRALVHSLIAFTVSAGSIAAQSAWIQRPPGSMPEARTSTILCYDGVRSVAILFGGAAAATGNPLDDTWHWDGNNWFPLAPGTVPAARAGHAATFDAARSRVVMFGGVGSGSGASLGDTWEWDGIDWSLRSSTGPGPRAGHAMAFDLVRGRVVLFGGSDLLQNPFGDTWEWDGTTWTQRFSNNRPPAMSGHAMVFDEARGRTLLFGGVGRETWEWDGVDWSRRVTTIAPTSDAAHGMAYDRVRARTVCFGVDAARNLDTWEWDGSDWRLDGVATRNPSESPELAYDEWRDQLVSFGGSAGETWIYLADTLSTYSPYGQGCVGSAGLPTMRPAPGATPRLGTDFVLELSPLPQSALAVGMLGRSNTELFGVRLPLPLDSIGMPGCALLLASVATLPATTTAGGVGSFVVRIPVQARLIGHQFYSQGLIVDLPATPLGLITSDAGVMRIGTH